MSELNRLLEPPDYEKRAKRLLNTAYHLNNQVHLDKGDESMRIGMSGSDDPILLNGSEEFIKRIEHLADSDGFVPASRVPGAATGDSNIDDKVGWNINDIRSDEAEIDRFSAYNYMVYAGVDFNEPRCRNISDYDWVKYKRVFGQICEYALSLSGALGDEMSAHVNRLNDGTVSIQTFFNFLFNDEVVTPSFDIKEAEERVGKLIEKILEYEDKDNDYRVLEIRKGNTDVTMKSSDSNK